MNSPQIFGALVPVLEGREAQLESVLSSWGGHGGSPFAGVPGTHAVRLTLLRSFGGRALPVRHLRPALLSLSAMIDGPADGWLFSLCERADPAFDDLWEHCAGWPGPGPAGCAAWLDSLRLRTHSSIVGNQGATVEEVVSALDRRARLRELALARRSLSPKELRAAYQEMLGR